MRILIFHGYLLDGTGSNVYNARLAEALVALGHEVHLLSQDRHAAERSFVDEVGDWDSGELRVRPVRERPGTGSGRCAVYRPDIGDLLPVYVADRYEGIEARTFARCSEAEIARYLQRNLSAIAELCARVGPQVALANHLVMGPAILARGLAGGVPYAVKIHGSALEYTVKPEPERFLPYAREGLARARGVLVGSRHTAHSLWATLADDALPGRTRLGPPGVDVARFAPRAEREAAEGLRELVVRLREAAPRTPAAEGAFARDPQAAAATLASVRPGDERLVAFVGKLIVSKGIDLLLAAWPLVLAREPRARLVVVGFGTFREAIERMSAALAEGELAVVREIAHRGRALESGGGPARPLRQLLTFLESLEGDERAAYLLAARALPRRLVLSGRLEHDELALLLPACEALVVPSTFPEAFGMVAAEAAACGVLPISAAHSGLLEVSEVLARALPAQAAGWLSFPPHEDPVRAIAGRVTGWLGAGRSLREHARSSLVSVARERWSWEGVARGVLDAAAGRLEGLRGP